MKRILSIYKRELRTFFNSPIAYIVLCVLLIGIGYFFFQTFFVSGQANLRTFFRFAAWSFVLFGPAVTMKLFAEEKKTGTIEPLLTLPIHEWEIVAGKFLAAWTLLGIYLLLTLSYPISVSFVGDLDGGPVIGGYIGLLFLGATFVSLGLFASAITRNQVVSLIVAFVVGLVLFVLDLLLPFVPAGLQSLVEFVGVDHHFQNISRGVVDTRDVIYTFSLTALFLFATAQALHTRLSDHSAKWRLNRWLYIGGAVGCFISVNALSSQAYARADLTEDRIYTLTDGTRSILGDLRDQLRVTAYFSRNLPAPFNAHERVLRDKLEEYRNASNGKLTFEFVDPDATGAGGEPDPAVIAKVNAAQIPKVEVNKFEKDQIQVVKVYMGVALAYQDKQETLPLVREVDDLEYQLTSRIAQLVRTKTPRLGFLTGHGEKTPSAGLANVAQLLGDKYESAEINLAQGEAALTDVDVLVVAGPRNEIPDAELFAIDQYVMNGGKAAFLIDRNDVNMQTFIGRPIATGLADLAAHYGARVTQPLVLDEQNQQVGLTRMQGNVRFQSFVRFPVFVRVTDLAADSPLTRNLQDLTLPFTTPIELSAPEGVTANVIAKSSERTWLFENDDSYLVEPQLLPQPEEGDFVGPRPLVATLEGSLPSFFADKAIPAHGSGDPVAATKLDASPETRVAVVAGSYFAADELRNSLGYVFFANLVDWLGANERLIGIRTKTIINRPLNVPGDAARNAVRYGNMFVPPLALIAFGIARWRWRARKKRKGAAILDDLPKAA